MISIRAQHHTHPWGRWQDGQVHDIHRGTDYDTSDIDMSRYLHKRARNTGWRLQSIRLAPGWIRFQFVTQLWYEAGSVEAPEPLWIKGEDHVRSAKGARAAIPRADRPQGADTSAAAPEQAQAGPPAQAPGRRELVQPDWPHVREIIDRFSH